MTTTTTRTAAVVELAAADLTPRTITAFFVGAERARERLPHLRFPFVGLF